MPEYLPLDVEGCGHELTCAKITWNFPSVITYYPLTVATLCYARVALKEFIGVKWYL